MFTSLVSSVPCTLNGFKCIGVSRLRLKFGEWDWVVGGVSSVSHRRTLCISFFYGHSKTWYRRTISMVIRLVSTKSSSSLPQPNHYSHRPQSTWFGNDPTLQTPTGAWPITGLNFLSTFFNRIRWYTESVGITNVSVFSSCVLSLY